MSRATSGREGREVAPGRRGRSRASDCPFARVLQGIRKHIASVAVLVRSIHRKLSKHQLASILPEAAALSERLYRDEQQHHEAARGAEDWESGDDDLDSDE